MSGKFDVVVDARGVARLTVAHDAKLNTLNPALLDEAIAALRELANHPGLRAAVLTLAPWRLWKRRQKLKPSSAACMAFALPSATCPCR